LYNWKMFWLASLIMIHLQKLLHIPLSSSPSWYHL
jgi:hypothetical protein